MICIFIIVKYAVFRKFIVKNTIMLDIVKIISCTFVSSSPIFGRVKVSLSILCRLVY